MKSAMFEKALKDQVMALGWDHITAENIWSEIRGQYSIPGRYYHNLSHLDNLVEELEAVKAGITDWQTIIFSIAYHDIIYDPAKIDNEERSAALAGKRLFELGVSGAQRSRCLSQIMATKGHDVSGDTDTRCFTDADLAILGTDPAKYKNYSKMIRQEYLMYDDAVYKPGRRKVLEHFLQMPAIYKTGHFHNKYEKQARLNLAQELAEL